MAEEKKAAINFTVVPDETADVPRIYSNFCAIQNSPLDFTLTFCEMLDAQSSHVVKAPVRARLVVPVQMIPGLIAALQDNFRGYQESFGQQPKGPLN